MTTHSLDNDIEYNENLVLELDITYTALIEARNRTRIDITRLTDLVDAWKNTVSLWEEVASPVVTENAREPSGVNHETVMAELSTAQDQLAVTKVKLEDALALRENIHIYISANNATRVAYSNAAIALRKLRDID